MKRAGRWCAAGLLAACAAVAGTVTAQDTHYWTEQYGNRARLLGGAVIGSSSDLSSVYYNPGRLALVKEPELLLAGTVFEYTTLTLREPRSSTEARSSRFSLTPSLFAGEFRFGWLGRSRLAYSFLTRNFSEFNTQGRLRQALPGLPGKLAELTESFRFDQKLTEYWGGLTWSVPVTDTLGVGVSTFVAARNQRGLFQRTTQGRLGGAAAVDQLTSEYRYHHWRALWKLGIGTRLDAWDIGLTVTTSGVKLFGSGQVGADFSRVGVPGESGALAFVDQTELPATYRSPWSVGVGGSRRFARTYVHLGIEWFGAVAPYEVLAGTPVAPLTGGAPIDPTVSHEIGGVVNAAAGVTHTFSERWEGYASVRTDFSGAVEGTTTNLAFTDWNLYHVAAGATLHSGSTEFTTGAVVAFGSSDSPPRLSASDLDSRYLRVTVILGFSFGFADQPTTQ